MPIALLRTASPHLRSIFQTVSMPYSVFVTRRVPSSGVELLKSRGVDVIQHDSDDVVPKEDLVKASKKCDGIFCLLTEKIDRTFLQTAGPQLKTICTMSVGYDHIDLEGCRDKGIMVGYTPDVLTGATAELTVALLLATCRRLVEGVTAVKDGSWGTWKPLWLCGPTLEGSTVGLVGYGRIGKAVRQRLEGFGVKEFLYTGLNKGEAGATYADLDDLLRTSDFVIACCSLTEQTRGLFNDRTFMLMKSSAIFVNTSRGGVVDQDSLCRALRDKQIGGAGLDVTTPEPLPLDSPLLTFNNCLVLPHIASATVKARSAMSLLTAQNILAALEGANMPARLV